MKKDQAIKKLLTWLSAQVGTKEGKNDWNPYAEKMDKLNITWGKKQNLAWCGTFVLCAFVECFGVEDALKLQYSPKPTGIPLCSAGASYFKGAGAWHSRPEVGDVVFFIINGSVGHTGIVVEVDEQGFSTIEGNTSNMVARRRYSNRYSGVAGFGRPKWSVVVTETAATPPANGGNVSVSLPKLRRGSRGIPVKAMQAVLINRGFSCGAAGIDGDFGMKTDAAVRNFQRQYKLAVDGVCGLQTWSRLIGG